MKIIACEQGSPEWIKARLGIPTASNFDQIVTPKTLKASATQSKYLCRLLAEWFLEEPIDEAGSGFMERGKDLEAEAARQYAQAAFERGIDIAKVGFITNDAGTVGCSPDRLVADSAGLEIKCPAIHTHIAYLLDPQSLYDAYRLQVQGGLWVSERDSWEIVSWNPVLPAVTVPVPRDEKIIDALELEVSDFAVRLGREKEKLQRFKDKHHADRLKQQREFDRDNDPFAVNVQDPGDFDVDGIIRMMEIKQ